jgi:hypothetical protein
MYRDSSGASVSLEHEEKRAEHDRVAMATNNSAFFAL